MGLLPLSLCQSVSSALTLLCMLCYNKNQRVIFTPHWQAARSGFYVVLCTFCMILNQLVHLCLKRQAARSG